MLRTRSVTTILVVILAAVLGVLGVEWPVTWWIAVFIAAGLLFGLAPQWTLPLRSPPTRKAPATATPESTPMVGRPSVPPFELPPTPLLVGRTREIAEIVAKLREPRSEAAAVLLLHGNPGVGKTALAVRVAREVAGDFPSGILFADLQGLRHLDETTSALLRSFIDALQGAGEPIPDDLPARRALYHRLTGSDDRGEPVLVVLDGVESYELARELLPTRPGCAVLMTSRHRLPIETYEVGPLDDAAARELFCELVGLPSDPDGENASIVDIVHRTAGYPLALQLTAAAMAGRRYWSLERIALIMHQRAPSSRDEHEDPRHRALDLCYALLADGERRTLTALGLLDSSVFRPWMLVALQANDPDDEVDEDTAWRRCERLVDVRLLERVTDDATGVVAFRVPEHVLDYARALWSRASRPEQQEAAQHRIAEARGDRHQTSAQDLLRRDVYHELERGELTRALNHARDALSLARESTGPTGGHDSVPAAGHDSGEGLALAALAEVLAELGGVGDALEMSELAQQSGPPAATARALRCQGRLLWRQRRLDEAVARLEHAAQDARRATDAGEEIRILGELAIAHAFRGQPERAMVTLAEIEQAGREVIVRTGLTARVGWATSVVLLEAFDAGDGGTAILDEAISTLDHAVERAPRQDLWPTWAGLQKARVERRQGRYRESRTLAVTALDRFVAMRHRYGAATCRWEIGRSYVDQQRYADAVPMLEEARRIFSTCGDRWIEATVATDLARAQRRFGRLVDAERALAVADGLYRSLGPRPAGAEPARVYRALQVEVETLLEASRLREPSSRLRAMAAGGGVG